MGYRLNYPEIKIEKYKGYTKGEELLDKLCERTFLPLWTYPNIHRNQGCDKSGDGKEICDLLAVFGNHVFIFSDKVCECASSSSRDWERWYRKTIIASARQLYGAERWILSYPDRVYLDKECSRPFPLDIPTKDKAIVHRILVAHGASLACRDYFGGGSGSLMLNSCVNAASDSRPPFTIGQINKEKGYIHILDDVTLEIVMRELDTVPDFIDYLTWKEDWISQENNFTACGEEDLLAYYQDPHIKTEGRQTGGSGRENSANLITVSDGYWEYFDTLPERELRKQEDRESYLWDEIIRRFSYHIMSGTSAYLSCTDITKLDELLQYLAGENRLRRRALSRALLEGKSKWKRKECRRMSIPSTDGSSAYLFLYISQEDFDVNIEEYGNYRRNLLELFLRHLKLRYPKCNHIVGLTIDPVTWPASGEDIILYNASVWDEEGRRLAHEAKRRLESLDLLSDHLDMTAVHAEEYPENRQEAFSRHHFKGKKTEMYFARAEAARNTKDAAVDKLVR
jgi:hypothetical protein